MEMINTVLVVVIIAMLIAKRIIHNRLMIGCDLARTQGMLEELCQKVAHSGRIGIAREAVCFIAYCAAKSARSRS
jgi:hypothetical protein